jgi:hypothetical protein
MVWRHAEQLTLAKTPVQRTLVEREIEKYAALQALMIRQFFTTQHPERRDAWCAEHGSDG